MRHGRISTVAVGIARSPAETARDGANVEAVGGDGLSLGGLLDTSTRSTPP